MPLFEFHCQTCDQVFEALVRRDEVAACPRCAASPVVRLISAPAAHVGGSLPTVSTGCPPLGSAACGPACCRLPPG